MQSIPENSESTLWWYDCLHSFNSLLALKIEKIKTFIKSMCNINVFLVITRSYYNPPGTLWHATWYCKSVKKRLAIPYYLSQNSLIFNRSVSRWCCYKCMYWTVTLTVLDTFSQVFLSRYTDVFDRAAHTCNTPLKLWRHRAMSATAAHFSIAATRPWK